LHGRIEQRAQELPQWICLFIATLIYHASYYTAWYETTYQSQNISFNQENDLGIEIGNGEKNSAVM
jgi:hypothetical protein